MLAMTKRIKQVLVGIITVLSLSVSAVASCACSHHQPAEKPKASCHGPSHHEESNAKSSLPGIEESCNCFQATPQRSVKGESFKLKKHAIAVNTLVDLLPESSRLISAGSDIPATGGSYSSAHASQIFPRGPPRL